MVRMVVFSPFLEPILCIAGGFCSLASFCSGGWVFFMFLLLRQHLFLSAIVCCRCCCGLSRCLPRALYVSVTHALCLSPLYLVLDLALCITLGSSVAGVVWSVTARVAPVSRQPRCGAAPGRARRLAVEVQRLLPLRAPARASPGAGVAWRTPRALTTAQRARHDDRHGRAAGAAAAPGRVRRASHREGTSGRPAVPLPPVSRVSGGDGLRVALSVCRSRREERQLHTDQSHVRTGRINPTHRQ